MLTGAEPIPSEASAAFVRHFRGQLASLGYEAATITSLATEAARLLDIFDGEAFDPLSELLERSGARARWNAQLARERPSFLASWIAPLVMGKTLDLLCGNGALGYELARTTGERVDLLERPAHRGTSDRVPATMIMDLEALRDAEAAGCYETVVLCTVLHHEADPEGFFSFAARLAARRIIIVENCVDDGFPAAYQQFMDLFFNRCLNRTALASPGQHRTPEGWAALGSPLGASRVHDRTISVPGIPLSHHLIVIDLGAAP